LPVLRILGKWIYAGYGYRIYLLPMRSDFAFSRPKELLESPAYHSLSRAALLIYQDFLAKREMVQVKRERR
jgi:hypothetical protein